MSEFWDREAATFDDEPDHGLRDPAVRAAWSALLERLLPPAPADVADLGCGTGAGPTTPRCGAARSTTSGMGC